MPTIAVDPLPFRAGEPPLLAVDAATGMYWRGEHQLALAGILGAVRSETGLSPDPRFLTTTDADILGGGVPAAFRDCGVPLRPLLVCSDPSISPSRASALTVFGACLVEGLDDITKRLPVTIGDIHPAPRQVDGAELLLTSETCERDGAVGSAVVAGVKGDRDPLTVAGVAMWLIHGMLATPLPDNVVPVVAAANDELRRLLPGASSSLCAAANRAQTLAESVVDGLIRDKTGDERSLLTLTHRIALEHAAPWPDLHRAEENCWIVRNVLSAAIDPLKDFHDKRELCAGLVVAARDGDDSASAWLRAWLENAFRCAESVDATATIDWELARRRDDEFVRERDAALAAGKPAPKVNPKLAGLRILVVAETEQGDVLESVHDCAVGALLIGLNGPRKEVLYAALLLDAPLGKGVCQCDGAEWSPVNGTLGALWTHPEPAKLNLRINETRGTNLQFQLVREYRAPNRAAAERDARRDVRYASMLAAIADKDDLEPVIAAGFTPLRGVCASNGEIVVIASGLAPRAAAIVSGVFDDMAPGDPVPVTLGRRTSEWRVTELPGGRKAVVPPAWDCVAPLKRDGCPLTFHVPAGGGSCILHLDEYAAPV